MREPIAIQASVLPEHVLRLPRSNPPPLSSFSRGGYDRRDCVICGGFRGGLRGGFGFRVGFAAVWVSRGLRGGSGFRGGLRGGRKWIRSQLSFSAAQIRSQLPRSSLSSLSAAPDPVSAGEEKAVPPQIWSQLEMLGCVSGGAGV
uniref:Uncharacterized protein n=1 Tax=Fagus sylvatica TaxID=28930 RepID=A0A2N9I1T7_FAGSY